MSAKARKIGFLMLAASARLEVPLVFAGIAAIAAVAAVMYSACAALEHHVAHWAFGAGHEDCALN